MAPCQNIIQSILVPALAIIMRAFLIFAIRYSLYYYESISSGSSNKVNSANIWLAVRAPNVQIDTL
jgi:hypothetical protein